MKRAIESVLNQTYKDIECVVVDDASDESSEDLCSQYAVRYIYIPKEDSRGGNYARNVGIRTTDGKYVAFLDDDDYWMPTKLEKQVDLISSKDNCEIVYCRRLFEKVRKDGSSFIKEDRVSSYSFQGDLSEEILFDIATTTSCILCSRDFLFEIGLFDEALKCWQDYDLTIRAAQKSLIYMVDEPLVVYRQDYSKNARISNEYYIWPETVSYIFNKYESLYSKLTLKKKLRVKMLIHRVGKKRAKRCGMRWLHLYHAVLYNMLYLFFRYNP